MSTPNLPAVHPRPRRRDKIFMALGLNKKHDQQIPIEPFSSSVEEVWSTPLLLERIASFLPRAEVACNVRCVNPVTAVVLAFPILLSEPCPSDVFAAYWSVPDVTRSCTLSKRRHLLALVGASGVVANFETALKAAGTVPTGETMEAAASAGKLESCMWLHKRGCPWGKALSMAASAGHLELCEWLLGNGCTWTRDAVYAAARGGHRVLMEWLLQQRTTDHGSDVRMEELLAAAVEGFDLNTFKQLYRDLFNGDLLPQRQLQQQPRRLSPMQQDLLIAAAAGSPGTDWQAKVKWIEDQDCDNDLKPPQPASKKPIVTRSLNAASRAAICQNAVARLRWLQERGYPMEFERTNFQLAGRHGRISLMRTILSGGQQGLFLRDAAEAAAEAGQLDFLIALKDMSPMDEGIVRAVALQAARSAQHMVLKWAVEMGFAIGDDSEVFPAAAQSGSAEMMDWVWRRNMIYSSESMLNAVDGGCEEALDWMKEHNFLAGSSQDPSKLYFQAARNGDLKILLWLRRQLPGPLPEGFVAQCERAVCPRPAIEWLVDEAGCAVDWQVAGLSTDWPGLLGWLNTNHRSLGSLSTTTGTSSTGSGREFQLPQ
ncbi:hypothetical protein Vretimale_6222 [Volvox reticuliferus]|uniref:Uncharacterized protein n=1 Tax=Volvox reticuliferus TaxID=1737510 RepID=A0A8J4G798_9CHLO|nr:hypothetical protein Vretifemale_8033 [Volvox reticuliferus]GIM01400.1 hypothetical protein Vretimale_6222 [Volvox reticuliferus]